MKTLLAAFAVVLLSTLACQATGTTNMSIGRYRVADNADACVANCANQAASCKRVCPTTFNTPCLNACDGQQQTCQQGCQRR
jgi:hypothetical protein